MVPDRAHKLQEIDTKIIEKQTSSKDIELEAMIRCCLVNDRKGQEFIYRKFFGSMHRMCTKYTNDEDELISIINDGFLKAFKKMDQFQFAGSFEGWLRRVVFSTLSDYFRKKNRGLAFLEIQDVGADDSDVLNKLYFEDLIAYLNHLPETTKKVFIKFHLEGYSHQEICDELGISEGTSKWHVFSARQKLKEQLTKNNLGK